MTGEKTPFQTKFKALLLASRPKTLWAAASPVMIGAALACDDGDINTAVLAATFLSAIFIQIGTNYANDYYDFIKGADTAERVGPLRATAAGLISPAQMKIAFILAFAMAAAFGGYLTYIGGIPILLIGLASIICGVLYTAGPLPLGYLGLGDVFVLIFFGPVAVAGTYYLQRSVVTPIAIAAGLAPGLLSTAILAVNNFRDYHTDKQTSKKTLVVRLGRRFGKAEYVFCIVAACAMPVILSLATGGHYLCNISLLTLAAAWRPITMVLSDAEPKILNRVLAQTGMLLVLFSILFSAGWIL